MNFVLPGIWLAKINSGRIFNEILVEPWMASKQTKRKEVLFDQQQRCQSE
jgi:hypothetical protein